MEIIEFAGGIYGNVSVKEYSVTRNESTSEWLHGDLAWKKKKNFIAPGSYKNNDRPPNSFKVSFHLVYFSMINIPLGSLIFKLATASVRLKVGHERSSSLLWAAFSVKFEVKYHFFLLPQNCDEECCQFSHVCVPIACVCLLKTFHISNFFKNVAFECSLPQKSDEAYHWFLLKRS